MSRLRAAAHLAALSFKAVVTALVIAIPLAGVWAASSLAAYNNGPIWLAVLSGALLFPGLPLLWEGVAVLRRRRKESPPAHILTFWDRLILRTFLVNAVFVVGFLSFFPQPVFAALTTRGDWMVDAAPELRPAGDALLGAADRLSWLWDVAHDNPYDDFDDDDGVVPESFGQSAGTEGDVDRGSEVPAARDSGVARDPAPTAASDAGADAADAGAARGVQPPESADEPDEPDEPTAPNRHWPFATTLHPLVKNFPEGHAGSIQSVGRYIAAQEPDPFMRAKAVHDFVADRIAYDGPNYLAGRYPRQDAEYVFQQRVGVCAGYARLVRAIGRAAGVEVVYVVGDARVGDNTEPTGEGHAWNAVKIEGDWYLMDATWASGHLDGATFVKRYTSDGFLAPPEVFGIRHFPDEPRWQLRERPLSRGEFNRQPMLRPRFFVDGFQLRSPDRSQVDTTSDFSARITSDGVNWVLVRARPQGGGEEVDCGNHHGANLSIRCPLLRSGAYTVHFFTGPRQYGSGFIGAGSVVVNRR